MEKVTQAEEYKNIHTQYNHQNRHQRSSSAHLFVLRTTQIQSYEMIEERNEKFLSQTVDSCLF